MKEIIIEFGYSTSPNYDRALVLAQKADKYETSGEGRKIRHRSIFKFSNFSNFERLFEITSGWKSLALFVGEEMLIKSDFWKIKRIFECWREASRLPYPETHCSSRAFELHCYSDEGPNVIEKEVAKCRKLNIVYDWKNYVYKAPNGMWVLDKEYFKKAIKNEIYFNKIKLCPLFNEEVALKAVDKLPDKYDPDFVSGTRHSSRGAFGSISLTVEPEELGAQKKVKKKDSHKVIPFKKPFD